MRIEVVRTGGDRKRLRYIGYDTDQDEIGWLRVFGKVVVLADFFNLPCNLASEDNHPNQYQYRFAVTIGKKYNQVTVNERAMPRSLQKLYRKMVDLAVSRIQMRREMSKYWSRLYPELKKFPALHDEVTARFVELVHQVDSAKASGDKLSPQIEYDLDMWVDDVIDRIKQAKRSARQD